MSLYKALDASPKAKAQWKTLTPDAKRDFTDWIEGTKESEARMLRVNKACVQLASGKRQP